VQRRNSTSNSGSFFADVLQAGIGSTVVGDVGLKEISADERDYIYRSSHACSPLQWLVDATRRRRSGKKYCDSHVGDSSKEAGAIVENSKDTDLAVGANVSMVSAIGRSFYAGISTSLGAVIVIMSPSRAISDNSMAFVLSLAAGVMTSATVLEFWFPLFTSDDVIQDLQDVVLYSLIGGILFAMLSLLVRSVTTCRETHLPSVGNGSTSQPVSPTSQKQLNCELGVSEVVDIPADLTQFNALRSGAILMLALTLHNFPEGLAVGLSSVGGQRQSFTVVVAIALHNIPEGIAIAAPLLAATNNRAKAFGMTVLSGLAEPAGATVTWMLMHMTGIVKQDFTQKLLCVVGGIMLAVVFMELIPDALQLAKARFCASGFLVGSTIMAVTVAVGA
jgi:ZIP family zinc transporter